MHFIYNKDFIEIKDKQLSKLDKFVFDFIKILEKHVKFVIISGYVAILFGRNRGSEDVDVFIDKIDFKKFNKLWKEISVDFECINTSEVKDAYENYLSDSIALRFAKKILLFQTWKLNFPRLILIFGLLKKEKRS